MSARSISPEELQKSLDAYARNGQNATKAAAELGIPRNTLQHRIETARLKKLLPDKRHDIPFGHLVKGVSTLYDDAGNERLRWVKTSQDHETQIAAFMAAIEALKTDIAKEPVVAGPLHTSDDLVTTYVVTDYHMGQLSWAPETGQDWDMKIAEDLLVKWFKAAIEAAPTSKVGILAQLGDFIHTDGILAITPTSHNLLDADTRFAKMVEVVIRVLRRIINMLLEKHEHVHVLLAEGNHDISSSIWLRALFAEKYSDNPRVTVDTTHVPYYAFEWGDTSLFFHHGHIRNIKEVSNVFVGQYREMYGRTKYSYAHMGHLHHKELVENQAMIIERHPTLAAKDAHSARGGYLSLRGANAITYSKKFGEVSRITIRPEMIR